MPDTHIIVGKFLPLIRHKWILLHFLNVLNIFVELLMEFGGCLPK